MIHAGADGAIVRSAFVEIIAKNQRNPSYAAKKLENMSRALKRATIGAR
jgi:tryptophan synthase alpha subunit